MDYFKELEQKLAAQIRHLQDIRQLETDKKNAIEREDIDTAEDLQHKTDTLIAEAQLMADVIDNLSTQIKHQYGSPSSEKIAQLKKIVKQLANEAATLTNENRRRLIEQVQAVFKQLDHVRAGKTALAGYNETQGQSFTEKGPNRGEK